MTNQQTTSSSAAVISAIASLTEVALLVVGGVAGYFLIHKPLTSVEHSFAQWQLEKETMPVLTVSTTHRFESKDDIFQSEDQTENNLLKLSAEVLNVGHVPITVNAIHIEVYDAVPSEKALRLLEEDGDACKEEFVSLHESTVKWNRQEGLDHRLDRTAVLLPEQRRRAEFPFLFRQPATPKWYKFVFRLDATLGDGKRYPKSHQAIHVVRLGTFPHEHDTEFGPERAPLVPTF